MSSASNQLREEKTGRVVVAHLEIADSLWKSGVGLLGRSSLASDAGMLFEPCNSIHTFAMRFSLDVLFLDSDGVLIRAEAGVRPWRICGPFWKARAVVELPSGTAALRKIEVGRRYTVYRPL